MKENYKEIPFRLRKIYIKKLKELPGPILIFGAGGFVGANVFLSFLNYRKDVYSVSRNPNKNKRLVHIIKEYAIPKGNVIACNINNKADLIKVLDDTQPKIIINLAAYGAYSWQTRINKIYKTNVSSLLFLLEHVSKYDPVAIVNAGSSSEYGSNSSGSKENFELLPNSHYSLSKIFGHYLVKYFGVQEKLPIIHFRLYSVYGPLEDERRLIPSLIKKAYYDSTYPSLVASDISRDFIFVQDVTNAIISGAYALYQQGKLHSKKRQITPSIFGETFNIGSGIPTSIKELVEITQREYSLAEKPCYFGMKSRSWDHGNAWYADISKAELLLKWRPLFELKKGYKITSGFFREFARKTNFK